MAQQMTSTMKSLAIKDTIAEDNKQHVLAKIYAKNSMDRFGDDMCGLLLSYLSLKDRFRLQCVSKQFRRTVFETVVDIDSNDRLIGQQIIQNSKIKRLLKTIAKKCPNIVTIHCRGIADNTEYILEVLDAFRNKFPHLRHIYCQMLPKSGQCVQHLAPLVTRGGSDASTKQVVTHCHGLTHLWVRYLSDVFDTNSRQLLAKNLRSFYFNYQRIDAKLMARFVAGNQSLKRLEMTHYDDKSLKPFADQLSRLPQLRILSLELCEFNKSLAHSLRTIGANCKQLKQLSLVFDDEPNVKTFDSLKHFQQLRRFELFLMDAEERQILDPLRQCQRLTHLTLRLQEMDTNFLDNCDKQWPRLQYLYIRYEKYTRKRLSAHCLDQISRLPALQTLVIDGKVSDRLRDNQLESLLSTSVKLKSIEIIRKRVSKFYCRKNAVNVD